ncbi:MAG: hypothetical protein IIC72_05825 [Acidobacteria bacterium]|nr:hypothetical protein [Acidobacteriota bacterium]TDI48991.1 MAG: hypothetical protein E2O97_10035 [Acidobacteriota bacterium]
MTGETSTAETAAPRPVMRIGSALVIAAALGSTLGIIIAQLLDDFGDGLLAEILGGDAVLYNNRVEITGATDIVWAGGFLLCLIVGLIALFAYPTQRGHGIPRLTFLWMVVHLLRQALVQAVMLPFDGDSQLALAYATLDAPPGLDVVIAAGGGVGLLLVALAAASAFLAFTSHRKLISSARKRLAFVLWIALIPASASVFMAIPFFLPDSESLVIRSLPLTAVMFLATLAAAPGTTTVQGPEDERTTTWPYGLGITLIVILLFYLTVLQGGVSLDPRLWG